MATKIARRSKREFRTARQAWQDISRKRGVTASNVMSKAHTSSHWVFKLKPIPAQAQGIGRQPLQQPRTQIGGGGLKRRRGL